MYIARIIKNQCSRANNSKVNNPIWSDPNSNTFKLLCLSSLPASLTKSQSKVTEKSWRHHFFFIAEGQVTSKCLVRYDQNSNPSEILCLSSFPVSLMKFEFIITEKGWRHHFPHSKSMGTLKGVQHRSQWSDLAGIRTCPRFYACPFVPASIKRIE